jgi:hypothetical protein
MPDTQGALSRFIRARTPKRQRDSNPSRVVTTQSSHGELNGTADRRTKYLFGFRRRHPSRSPTHDREMISKLDQIPSLEMRETRLAAWLEAMLEYEIERNR